MPGNYGERDNFDFRRKAQRVFVDRPTGDVILRLHETDIVRVTSRGDVILSTGGWATRKTLTSMNDALELFGMWVESISRSETQGNWQVTDSDGSVHPYNNNRQNFTTTIRAKSADDRQRAEWLADAYEIPYTPRAAPPPAAAAPSGPRVAAAPAAAAGVPPAAQYNGGGAAAAAATAVRPAGIGGSWANVAKTSSNPGHVTTGPPHAAAAANNVRVTGRGGPAAAGRVTGRGGPAAAGRVTGPGGPAAAGRVTGPGGAAAAAPHRTTGPPGFSGGSSSGSGVHQQHQQQPPAMVTWAPPKPTGGQGVGGAAPALHQQFAMAVADLGHDDEDAHLCVVCMEEPRSIVLVPCGHMALCKSCCEQIVAEKQKCPMCCQDVEYHVEVDA